MNSKPKISDRFTPFFGPWRARLSARRRRLPGSDSPQPILHQLEAFSAPLAQQLCEWILNWEPDLTESIKWNMLCFSGRKLVCGLSACQRHLGLTFFRGTELPDPEKLFPSGVNNTNILTIQLTTLEGLNCDALRALLHAAVELDADPMAPPAPKVKRASWPMPDYFKEALSSKQNRAAAEFFRKLKPTYHREYFVWLSMAKRSETRARRLAETLAALAAGRKWAQRKQVLAGHSKAAG
jgi:hypothetical protein